MRRCRSAGQGHAEHGAGRPPGELEANGRLLFRYQPTDSPIEKVLRWLAVEEPDAEEAGNIAQLAELERRYVKGY